MNTVVRMSQNLKTQNGSPVTVKLRVLETTDIHGHILPFDYLTCRSDASAGLARTATLIRKARQETENCLLFDTGDFLQGDPLIDGIAQNATEWSGRHPAISAMNALAYDAVGLGNHEFNFGIDWLLKTFEQAHFPVICANAVRQLGPTPHQDHPLVPQYTLLKRKLQGTNGQTHELCIGVMALLPPQITQWDHFHLEGRIITRPIVETARAFAPKLRAEGADVVIALAHTGIGQGTERDMAENVALDLADVPGIDAILAGHNHLVFPAPDHKDIEGVDIKRGLLKGVPTVMAGSHGSHLGVLDLTLCKTDDDTWRITHSHAEARPVKSPCQSRSVRPDKKLCDLLKPAHLNTLRLMEKPVGQSTMALHSYLNMVRSDPLVHLVARAKRNALRFFVPDKILKELPVLSAASAFRTGGRAGPQHFTDIPAGPLTSRHAADIYPFPNMICAVILTGAEIHAWLEDTSLYFNQITPGHAGQPLINPAFPGHHFDVIEGLTYEIDLAAPPGSYAKRPRASTGVQRITNLRYQGQPIDYNQEFIVATNNFRLFGSLPIREKIAARCVYQSRLSVIDALKQELCKTHCTIKSPPAWSFRPISDTSVVFDTGPGLRTHPEDIAKMGLVDLGDTPEGFARFRFDL